VCSQTFVDKHALNVHQVVHTEEHSLGCDA